MDFTNLKGMVSQDVQRFVKLTPSEKQLRKSLYVVFANTCSLQELYADVRARFQKYINENVLRSEYDRDILNYFFEAVKYDHSMNEQHREKLEFQVSVRPLLPPINIAPQLKFSNQVFVKMKKIGYQHLYMLSSKKDSSESSNTNTSDSDMGSGDNVPLAKKLKTCQNGIELDCESMLQPHINNKTATTGTELHIDILIYMDSSFCKDLSKYLGVIYIEELLEEVEGKPFNNLLPRLDNKSARLYRLIQSYVNKKLITGSNNVCLVNHLILWQNINANVRAIIGSNKDDLAYIETSETSNFHVKLGGQPSFLDYVEAISIVIDKALNCNCHVIAKYECGQNLYSRVKLSLISIIPLYVLRYFSQCKILEHEFEL